jgi:hypothetical protein
MWETKTGGLCEVSLGYIDFPERGRKGRKRGEGG